MNPLLYRASLAALALLMAACRDTSGVDSLNHKTVVLPDGSKIYCEVMIRSEDMGRGMMHRESLDANKGMLFVHTNPGPYPYWMHNVKIPLDIIWLSPDRTIVEISQHTPPCLKESKECPIHGGNFMSMYVLELAAGGASKHKLKLGDTINW